MTAERSGQGAEVTVIRVDIDMQDATFADHDDTITGTQLDERWLQRVGPTAVAIVRQIGRLAEEFNAQRLLIDKRAFAAFCGVKETTLLRTFHRCAQFHLIDEIEPGHYVVPMLVPAVSARRSQHHVWLASCVALHAVNEGG